MADGAIAARIRAAIRDVPDFPQPGILFRDITPVLAEPGLIGQIADRLAGVYRDRGADVVAGIESRGFLFGAPIADRLGVGFVPIRKPGKLPWRTVRVDYALEYGQDALEAHEDAVNAGQRVLVVDDLLATGGTAAGAAELVRRLGGTVIGAAFVVELVGLGGRARLGDLPVQALVRYE